MSVPLPVEYALSPVAAVRLEIDDDTAAEAGERATRVAARRCIGVMGYRMECMC